ncbi:MAG: GNAT family N-acetyltransferase [Candidatus Thorarchaeota archaeon]
MHIQTVNINELEYVRSICLDPSVDKKTRSLMENGMDIRTNWIKKMKQIGLEILVAIEKPKEEIIHYKWVGKIQHSDLAVFGNVPMGLLEYLPVEYALEPIIGLNSLFINCMWILPPFWRSGVATALINEFINKAKNYGGACTIAYDGDKWFGTSIKYMPSSFFKKFGFKEIDREGTRVLLFLDLGSSIPPKFIQSKSEDLSKKDLITIDLFYNSQCPWAWFMINSVKNKLKGYPNINLNLVNTDDRKVIENYGISRGIRINGKPVIKRMAPWNEIKKEIDKIL